MRPGGQIENLVSVHAEGFHDEVFGVDRVGEAIGESGITKKGPMSEVR